MRKRFKVKFTRLAHRAQDHVFIFTFSVWGSFVGNIWKRGSQSVQFGFDFRNLLIQLCDLIANHTHRFDLRLPGCCIFHLPDLL